MRLDQKYFVPFMAGVAILTMIIIVYSSFTYKERQDQRFRNSIAESDSLITYEFRGILDEPAIVIEDLPSKPKILLFWASWSEKSRDLMQEMESWKQSENSFQVLAALVLDATESLPEIKEFPSFNYIDGSHMYNELKVPGIPSYIIMNESNEVVHVQIGYEPEMFINHFNNSLN